MLIYEIKRNMAKLSLCVKPQFQITNIFLRNIGIM